MELLLVKYGYFLLFFGVAIEGEVFLLAGSFLAHQGTLYLPFVIVVAIAGNCAASQVYYTMARARGRAWLENRFGQHPSYTRVIGWMSRHTNWLLFFSRYAFGFRIIIPAACGALGMSAGRFTGINLIAGIIWAIPTAMLGYYSGHAAAMALAGVRHYQSGILAGLLFAALLVVVIRHLKHVEWAEDLKVMDLHMLAPSIIGVMGVINVASAVWPRPHGVLQAIGAWLPLEVTQPSRPVMLLAGIALLQVTRNLARRKRLAWYVAMAALSISLLTHVTRALDIQHSLLAALLLAYLYHFRGRFRVPSDPGSLRLALLMIPLLGAAVLAYGSIGLNHRREQYGWQAGPAPVYEAFNVGILIRQPSVTPKTPSATWFLHSIQIAGWLTRFYLLVLLLRPVVAKHQGTATADGG